MTPARREVGCALGFTFLEPSVLALQIAPTVVLAEELTVVGAPPPEEVLLSSGRSHVIRAEAGPVSVRYSARVSEAAAGPAVVDEFDEAVLVARRQSRYCPSDAMAEFANRELAGFVDADDVADRVASWVFERIAYDPFVSGPSDTAVDTLLAGRGVCRDFAHLTIAMCRALFIPARLVSVYAPGIDPMDFHAVVEVWRNERWEVIDPSRMAPRSSLVRIATGRDAADTALAATITGDVELTAAEVFAVVDGDLPLDDHVTATVLG
ncbi:MAG TPA: transglutaminase domain-containing protein [Acidimicrobiales bacterium]|nr:transglutaminase domain-containing protein [Acidimicrobiales bacterium]